MNILGYFLKNISGERIWSELKKICVGRFGGDVLTTMVSRCGLASLLGLPEDCDVATCREIFNYNSDRSLEPMTVLSALFKNQQDIDVFHKRLACYYLLYRSSLCAGT